MGTHKISFAAIALALTMGACGGDGTVSQEKYDDILKEYNELKQSVADAQNTNVQQAVTLNQTLTELAEISGTTEVLRSDIEQGRARLSQAEKISNSIEAIKEKIADLERRATDDTYARMVRNLKTIVSEKEREIADLKSTIQQQQNTIRQQEGTINQQTERIHEQNSTINDQAAKLQVAVARQAQLLNQAGHDFEDMGDDIPDVSRKKNKRKVESWAAEMYSKAIIYYQRAQEYGHQQSANDAQRVQNKLRNLNN